VDSWFHLEFLVFLFSRSPTSRRHLFCPPHLWLPPDGNSRVYFFFGFLVHTRSFFPVSYTLSLLFSPPTYSRSFSFFQLQDVKSQGELPQGCMPLFVLVLCRPASLPKSPVAVRCFFFSSPLFIATQWLGSPPPPHPCSPFFSFRAFLCILSNFFG